MGDERESYEVMLTPPNDGEKEGWKLVKKKCKTSLCCTLDYFLTLLRDILEKEEPQPRLELQSKIFMSGQLFSTEFLDGMEILVN